VATAGKEIQGPAMGWEGKRTVQKFGGEVGGCIQTFRTGLLE
jgi:hypothetical protein